jgi:hypothetical protein
VLEALEGDPRFQAVIDEEERQQLFNKLVEELKV